MSINKRLLALFSIIILFACASLVQAANKNPLLRVTFLDVGQGDSVLIRTAEKTILLDAGDDRSNAANVSIIPYLKKEGIKKIDTCIISHPHRDHFGGFIDLVQAIPIGEFLYAADFMTNANDGESSGNDAQLYQKLHFAIMEKGIAYNQVTEETKFDWGTGIKVDLFHVAESVGIRDEVASAPKVDGWKLNANNQSLIFRVSAGKISYMFSGDAEKEVEANMVAKFGSKLRATVMKSGHHGSKTSNSPSFLENVFGGPNEVTGPRYAVISVGAKNSFKHPNQETLDNYNYWKVKYFRTDLDGPVDSFTDGQT
ncbi:MAG TPA: MBL fold metallo-hydrolase, partial [Candidatus Ozemobacteraceae bacterium]|nr:MBL fold metallo-hydrolase [Candidatus Ozemobacteraceae bacterium]